VPVKDNAKRLVFFEDWMDTSAAMKVFETVEDIQVQKLHYDARTEENYAAMSRTHGYQVQPRTELQIPWFPDSDLIERAPNLVAVSSAGAGFDYIDVAALTKAGIAVVNQTGTNKESVAEHALGMMLTVSKKMIQADRRIRREHNVDRWELIGTEMLGKKLGVVGIGQIGSRTAELCKLAFKMDIIAYDPYLTEEEINQRGAEKVDFSTLLAESDFITVHCPRTDETLGMFGAKEFKAMKTNAVFVITARGGIVNESELASALANNDILGAGVDVFWEEPTSPDNCLMGLDNILVTPHHAGITIEANKNMAVGAAEQWIILLRGGVPPRLVNPAVWPVYQDRFEAIMGFRPSDYSEN
tara:strand:+ start:2691 stop:3761 length:1071 start_codon:yes stop_codon:yes gene_type:complete